MKPNPPPETSEAGFFCPAYVGLRFFLLMAVLEGHYWYDKFPGTRVGTLSLSVPCFFALSGFLISHTLFCYESLPKTKALATFYVRRALRILPAYYIVLLLANAIWGVPFMAWQLTYLLNLKIYLISNYDPAEFISYLNYRNFNAIHFWSVCVEEQFYILYPLFVLFGPRRWRTQCLLAALALSILSRIYLLQTAAPRCLFGGLPFVAGEYILWGCLFAWMDFRDRWHWLRHPATLYASLLGLIILGWNDKSFLIWAQWRPPLHQTAYCLLIATFIASLRHNGSTRLAKFMAWKPFRRLGTMSYGAYLIHSFLNPTVDRLAAQYPALAIFPACPRAVLGAVLTLAAAAILWYGFEKPIQGLRKGWTTQKVASPDP